MQSRDGEPFVGDERPVSVRLPAPVERATERLFCALSSARGRRIFHPRGIAYRIEVDVGTGLPGASALPPGGRLGGVARFSRGLGLPTGAPDFLGLALSLESEQDLLLATSAAPPGVRFLPLPARSFFGPLFSSLLPVTVRGELLLLGARVRGHRASGGDAWEELESASEAAPVQIELLAARPSGRWRPVALALTGARLSAAETQSLSFDPWRCRGGLVPWSWVNRLRAPAYRGSRRGRATARTTS